MRPTVTAASTVRSPYLAQPAQAARPAAPAELSRPEQQMIERYFPAQPALSTRLYGPTHKAQDLTPARVGAHLDLRG